MCGNCSLLNYGRDCHNNIVNKIMLLRTSADMTQKELSENTGINIRQIQKYESGEYNIHNMTLASAISLANALECDVTDLIDNKKGKPLRRNNMKTWTKNGYAIYENAYDGDLTMLKFYDDEDNYLGNVTFGSVEQMEHDYSLLDDGADPIEDGWEDGNGNLLDINGWGQ